jgi:hypothetical protein
VKWNTKADHQEDIRKICEDTDLLTVYYETNFRDARFRDWRWAGLARFDVASGKPLNGKRFMIESIGNAKDDSLFGFVAKHWPNYLDGSAANGWLICDDGSMESADFIHFDDKASPPSLALIHVKGSGSSEANRGLSVSDYEVVVGQAIKNLRYLDRSHISRKLSLNEDKKVQPCGTTGGVRRIETRS